MARVYFTADPDGLDALNTHLTSIDSDMQGIGVAIGSYDPADLSSSGDVWTALQGFNDAWSKGLTTINDNVKALQDRLTRASGRYRGTEGDIENAARQETATVRQAGTSIWHVT